jgi:hypothetical protein
MNFKYQPYKQHSAFKHPQFIIGEILSFTLPVPWLRQLVAGLSPWRPRFAPSPCGIYGGQSGTGTGFPCQYHSTIALHARISPDEQWARWCLLFRDIFSPHRHGQQQQVSHSYET